jgi:phage shock protein A
MQAIRGCYQIFAVWADAMYSMFQEVVRMNFTSRFKSVIDAHINAALNKLEDPKQTMDTILEDLRDDLASMDGKIADVATARRRAEIQWGNTKKQIKDMEDEARHLVDVKNSDAARLVVSRKLAMEKSCKDLEITIEDIKSQEAALNQSRSIMQIEVDQFQAKRAMFLARYTADEAKVKITEEVIGIGKSMYHTRELFARVEYQALDMQARAEALDGMCGNMNQPTPKQVDEELERLTR